MIGAIGGEVETGLDVLAIDVGIVVEDLLNTGAGGEQLEDVANAQAHAANARLAAADAGGPK